MTAFPPRILVVANDHFPPFRVDVVVLFLKYLSREFSIEWVMREKAPTELPKQDADETYYLINRKSLFTYLLSGFGVHVSRVRAILAGRYDIVQCRDTIVISSLYAIIARLANRPFVYWMSFPMEEGYWGAAKNFWMAGRPIKAAVRGAVAVLGRLGLGTVALPLAAHVFVQSDGMREVVCRKYRVDRRKCTSVPMGVDLENMPLGEIVPADDPLYRGKRVALYLGTLEASRRLEVPARGVAWAMRECPDLLFVAIGRASEQERSTLLKVFQTEGVENRVVFRDQMPLTEALSHVRRADVCLSPVPNTPLFSVSTPTKLCEYIAMGRQVVANHLPDHRKVVAGTGIGILTDYDALSFRDGVLRALSMGAPSSETISFALDWLKKNRDYRNIARDVAGRYREIFSASKQAL